MVSLYSDYLYKVFEKKSWRMRTLSARTFSNFFCGKIWLKLHSVSPGNIFKEKWSKGSTLNVFNPAKTKECKAKKTMKKRSSVDYLRPCFCFCIIRLSLPCFEKEAY